ncbi:MAG: glycosyltransferase family 39 protein [Methanomicrobiales archaeon]
MLGNNLKEKLLKKSSNTFLLIILTLIISIITLSLINIQSHLGIYYWDIFVYLGNALRFAGMGVGDQMLLSPFLPFLTSLIFRAGYVWENAVFILSGILFVLGIIGLYLLLNQRFNSIFSFAGSIFFASLSLIIPWAVSGATDVPAISLSIWAMLFTILAVKSDGKYYYLAFPLAALAFLTRYTSGFMVILILFYIFINKDHLKQAKNILIGILLAIVISCPFLVIFYLVSGDPFPFVSQVSNTATGAVTTANPGYNLDVLYYLKNLPNYISNTAPESYGAILNTTGPATIVSYIILIFIAAGITIYLYNIIKKVKNSKNWLNRNNGLKLVLLIILSSILIFSYAKISYLFSEILLLIIAFLIYKLIKDYQDKADLDVLFFVWFSMYFLFLSYHAVKVDRYILTALPALAYFLALALNCLANKIPYKRYIKNGDSRTNYSSVILSLFIVCIMLFSSLSFINEMPRSYYWIDNEEAAADFLISYDPDYQSKVIVADRGPAFSWYLKKRVYTRIPRNFKTNQDFYQELDNLNADYYIDVLKNPKLEIPGYVKIKTIGIIAIYQKI